VPEAGHGGGNSRGSGPVGNAIDFGHSDNYVAVGLNAASPHVALTLTSTDMLSKRLRHRSQEASCHRQRKANVARHCNRDQLGVAHSMLSPIENWL
jgi:hypothetical protein